MLDKEVVLKDIEEFSVINKLEEEEHNELKFLCNSFVKFYNRNIDLDISELFELFDFMIDTRISPGTPPGLKTRANLFYKEIESIKNLRHTLYKT